MDKTDYLNGKLKQMINTMETFMYSAVTGLISYLLPDPQNHARIDWEEAEIKTDFVEVCIERAANIGKKICLQERKP